MVIRLLFFLWILNAWSAMPLAEPWDSVRLQVTTNVPQVHGEMGNLYSLKPQDCGKSSPIGFADWVFEGASSASPCSAHPQSYGGGVTAGGGVQKDHLQVPPIRRRDCGKSSPIGFADWVFEGASSASPCSAHPQSYGGGVTAGGGVQKDHLQVPPIRRRGGGCDRDAKQGVQNRQISSLSAVSPRERSVEDVCSWGGKLHRELPVAQGSNSYREPAWQVWKERVEGGDECEKSYTWDHLISGDGDRPVGCPVKKCEGRVRREWCSRCLGEVHVAQPYFFRPLQLQFECVREYERYETLLYEEEEEKRVLEAQGLQEYGAALSENAPSKSGLSATILREAQEFLSKKYELLSEVPVDGGKRVRHGQAYYMDVWAQRISQDQYNSFRDSQYFNFHIIYRWADARGLLCEKIPQKMQAKSWSEQSRSMSKTLPGKKKGGVMSAVRGFFKRS